MYWGEVYKVGSFAAEGGSGVSRQSQVSRALNAEQRSIVCPGKGSEQENSTARLPALRRRRVAL